MSKNIILLADGTWNDGDESNTNINWMRRNLIEDSNQLIFYEAGVGDKWFNERTGGAFGVGLSRNVRILYTHLIKHYEPGDAVYCYGFSRGAFTVRSLCGFIGLVGQIKSASDEDVAAAYQYYQFHEPGEEDNWAEKGMKPKSAGDIPIRQLGVFDTVGSLGVPLDIEVDPVDHDDGIWERAKKRVAGWFDRAGDRIRRPIKGFHNTSLSEHIEEALHALALDERRAMFAPTLWTSAPGVAYRHDIERNRVDVAQTVEQVWFAGVHSDVGGGYNDVDDNAKLSHIPLYWMVEKSIQGGLRYMPNSVESLRDRIPQLIDTPQHDSMTKTWKKLHSKLKRTDILRPVGNDARTNRPTDTVADNVVDNPEFIHKMVHARMGKMIEVLGEDGVIEQRVYTPENYIPRMVKAEMA